MLKKRHRSILIYVLLGNVCILALYHLLVCQPFDIDLSWGWWTSSHSLNDHITSPSVLPSVPFLYSLDSTCRSKPNDVAAQDRAKEFDAIFDTRRWEHKESRSGPGSSLEGAFDWIKHLRSFVQRFHIQSIADVPCGDTYWQFSLTEINAIEHVYFGGDISALVIDHNRRFYASRHANKLFHYWDLAQCPLPTFTYRNVTHRIPGKPFDLVIVRDALQHMHIRNGLKAVQNVVRSGAKYFAVSSYPPNGKASANTTRSLDKKESLPRVVEQCLTKNYCQLGAIKDGSVYGNNINCHPFNFPLDKTVLLQPSHEQFKMESDEIHIYRIDDELKEIVNRYDAHCHS